MWYFKLILAASLCLCMTATLQGASKTSSEAAPEKPNVQELIKPANELMAQAQELYVEGEAKKAVETYRKAHDAFTKIEGDHPQWVKSSDFGPIRFRKAICETEIDRILLEEAQATSRTIAVTDTRELEKKLRERKLSATTNRADQTVQLVAKQGEVTDDAAAAADAAEATRNKQREAEETKLASASTNQITAKPLVINDELKWAKDMLQIDRYDDAEKSILSVLKQNPDHAEARYLMALLRMRQGRYVDAQVVLDDLQADNPKDEATLLLLAGAYAAEGSYPKAMDALDAAIKLNPKRPDAYMNMAWLLLEMRTTETAEAEMYYRQAVKLGLQRDRKIETRLGIKP